MPRLRTLWDSATRTVAARPWLAYGLFFLATFAVYQTRRHSSDAGDAMPARYLPVSLLNEGDFDLDEFTHLYEGKRKTPYFLTKRNGHYYSTYPVASGVLATPVYALSKWTGHELTERRISRLGKRAASLFTAGSAVLLAMAMAPIAGLRLALALGAAYAFGTSSWEVSAQALWQHPTSQLFSALTLLLLVLGERRQRWVRWAGLACALSVVCRPTNVIAAAVFTLYVLHRHRREFLLFLLLAVPAAILMFAYNLSCFGTLVGGYVGCFNWYSEGMPFSRFLRNVAGLLVSPNRGLLIYAPFTLLAPLGLAAAWRRRRFDLFFYTALVPLGYLLLIGRWHMWYGGHSFGPRLLVDVAPHLVFLMAPAAAFVSRRRCLAVLTVALVLASVFVQTLGVFFEDGNWNNHPRNVDKQPARVWDWHDTQIGRTTRTAIGKVRDRLDQAFPKPPPPPVPLPAMEPSDRYLVGAHYYLWYPRNFRHGFLRGRLTPPQEPLLGLYESRDTKVVAQHVAWCSEYGVDFLTLDWWPRRREPNQAFWTAFSAAPNLQDIRFCVFFETWDYDFGPRGSFFSDETIREFRDDLAWLAENVLNHPAYLRVAGRPVLFLYLTRTLSGKYREAVAAARADLKARLGVEPYLIADEVFWGVNRSDLNPDGTPVAGSDQPQPDRMRLFDAIFGYNLYDWSQPTHAGYGADSAFVGDCAAIQTRYAEAARRVGVRFVPDVIPGYNDRGVRRRENHFAIPRQWRAGAPEGSFLAEALDRLALPFVDPHLAMLLVTSWNEWNEDSAIEPLKPAEPTQKDNSPGGADYTQGLPYAGHGFTPLRTLRDKVVAISGRVFTPSNQPAARVTVTAWSGERALTTDLTDSAGYYTLSRHRLPPGPYAVSAGPDGARANVTVLAGHTVTGVSLRIP
jgi:glycoprotein endo-alpha-1,2-mannosidase